MSGNDAGISAAGIPVFLAGARIRALVVGGGAVAARKLAALLAAGAASVRVVAPRISAELRAAAGGASAGRVTLIEREYAASDLGDANLVIAATDVREVNARVGRDADAAGRLASIADAPTEGAWSAMATHRAGPLTIGVSAGGVPTAAARVRDEIGRRFDGRYAEALSRLAAMRTALVSTGGTDRWRAAAAELTGPAFCETVERGEIGALVDRWEEKGAWA